MSTERLGNIGYFALKKEATPGTAVTPDDYIPLYEENFQTKANFKRQDPIYGSKFSTFGVLQGQRGHTGDVTILAEANTISKVVDMLLTRGSVSGSSPYTWPFTLSSTTNPKSYTIDISTGNVVKRFMGVGASRIADVIQDNEVRLKMTLSGLASFEGREIASISGSGPYSVVLKTDYDPNPTNGLVIGDLIRFALVGGTSVDATVATVTNGTTFTTATNPTTAAGDMVHLRPATPSFTLVQTFLFSKTQYCFGATASAALSATHTPLDQGSDWEVMHSFQNDEGEKRSGSADPASLARTTADATFKAKKFFDTPEDIRRFNALEKQAVVIRHYAGSTNQYELRITLNHIKTDSPLPSIKPGSINYSEMDYIPAYDLSDGQGMDIKVINALAAI